MDVVPSHFSRTGAGSRQVAETDTNSHPMESVSWIDAANFCNKLSRKEGLTPCYAINTENVTSLDGSGYRLPSEAEWEFACRAGTTTVFAFGRWNSTWDLFTWYADISDGMTHSVGENCRILLASATYTATSGSSARTALTRSIISVRRLITRPDRQLQTTMQRIFPTLSQEVSSQVLFSVRLAFFSQFLFGVCSDAGVRQGVWHDDLGRLDQLLHRVPGRGDLIDGCLVSDRDLGHAQAAQFVDSLGHGDIECLPTPREFPDDLIRQHDYEHMPPCSRFLADENRTHFQVRCLARSKSPFDIR
jgi:hypothetical protein